MPTGSVMPCKDLGLLNPGPHSGNKHKCSQDLTREQTPHRASDSHSFHPGEVQSHPSIPGSRPTLPRVTWSKLQVPMAHGNGICASREREISRISQASVNHTPTCPLSHLAVGSCIAMS